VLQASTEEKMDINTSAQPANETDNKTMAAKHDPKPGCAVRHGLDKTQVKTYLEARRSTTGLT
jgi:hypothetical protein